MKEIVKIIYSRHKLLAGTAYPQVNDLNTAPSPNYSNAALMCHAKLFKIQYIRTQLRKLLIAN